MRIKKNKRATGEKGIRVFISSTFKDMKEERDVLVKFIFPKLQKLCEQRFVPWSYVDLRWGVTDEQVAEGKVLPLCLEEIKRCRPYFIGILGERYGWIPEEIPEELLKKEEWLKEHKDHSVTELEIIHGVLEEPGMADYSFFYFRDPDYVKSVPPDEKPDFMECATDGEIETYGKIKAEQRAKIRCKKLKDLKTRIQKSGMPVRLDYKTPKEFGNLVFEDLKRVIVELFPEKGHSRSTYTGGAESRSVCFKQAEALHRAR